MYVLWKKVAFYKRNSDCKAIVIATWGWGHIPGGISRGKAPTGLSGLNLGLLCIPESDACPFCENYAKLYYDTKHLEKRLNRGW